MSIIYIILALHTRIVGAESAAKGKFIGLFKLNTFFARIIKRRWTDLHRKKAFLQVILNNPISFERK
jgi:hypothetical protein